MRSYHIVSESCGTKRNDDEHGKTYRFLKSTVLEHPPNACIDSEIFPKVEEGLQSHSGCVQRALDITRHPFGRILVSLDSHDTMPEVASEEEILSQAAWILFRHDSYRSIIRSSELDWEGGV